MSFLPILQSLTHINLSKDEALAVDLSLQEVSDWSGLLNKTEVYAISNLFLKHVNEHNLSVPQARLLSLKALAIRHRSAADARYQLMQELSDAFKKNNIPSLALKGLALAPMIYPEDKYRPMRDIDILVPRSKEQLAAKILREIGFNLPETQPSKFMRDSHQLPNATKKVNGFTISVEIHHDAITRDVSESLVFEDAEPSSQTFTWRDLQIRTLGHEQMLHQVSRHLESLHPGAVLKLINVLDVVLYAEQYVDEIDWQVMRMKYTHVINTLKCLHMIVPLSIALQEKVGGVSDIRLQNIGEIMLPLTHIINKRNSITQQFDLLFKPSDWWLHLYYNVDPEKTLIFVKLVRHPLTILKWLWKRLISRILGG